MYDHYMLLLLSCSFLLYIIGFTAKRSARRAAKGGKMLPQRLPVDVHTQRLEEQMEYEESEPQEEEDEGSTDV